MGGRVHVGRAADPGDRTFFFEIIPDLLVILGFDGFARDLNSAWQASLGWTRDELLAKPLLEFAHPEDQDKLAQEMERVKKGVFMLRVEGRFMCKDGSYKWFLWDAAGFAPRSKCYLLGREIVLGKKPGERRKAMEGDGFDALAVVEEMMGFATWEMDLERMQIRWSERLRRLHGLTVEEMPGDPDSAMAIIVEEDQAKVVDAMRIALETGETEVDYRARHKQGTILHMRSRVRVAKSATGVPRRLFATVVPLDGNAQGKP